MTITIHSDAFDCDKPIPKKYTGDGEDISPPLSWEGVPQETKELALICEDPDAPTPVPWVHWLLYKLPPQMSELAEGTASTEVVDSPAGARQGQNSWPTGRTIGYRGPMPPVGHGQHRYFFTLYALDRELDLPPGMEKHALLNSISPHILDHGTLIGVYER